ncbi:MAG: glycosyltransferase [Muribaculaceae bacterium]|nr:glycosyltransferase [Muribaculaceae bacterium]
MKISIITVSINSHATIADTMESVLAQDYEDFEHIIVDGGSTDGTVDLIKQYEPRYGGRLKWVSQPDNGLYDAMNRGIAMATGDAVGTLNSDDFLTSTDVLSRVARGLEGVDAVYGDVHYVSPTDLSTSVRCYSSASFRPWMMRLGYMPAHPSFYCRRHVYERYGTFDTRFRVASDFELLLRLIYIHRISCRYLPLDFVTMRTGGISNSGLGSHRNILHDHFEAYRKNRIHSCLLFESVRYVTRLFELALPRIIHSKSSQEYPLAYKPLNTQTQRPTT